MKVVITGVAIEEITATKLSLGKSDSSHNAAMKSCLLRVPGSKNSKCVEMSKDPEVKILQRWNGHRPHYKLLFGRFYTDLVGKKQKEQHQQQKQRYLEKGNNNNSTAVPITIVWIDKLLQTPIEDYRKHTRDLIIIPYLIVCKQLTDRNQIYDIVMKWADKYAELKRLEPSRREFSIRVRRRIDEVMRDRIPPMTFETLKEKCPELYETLRIGDAQ